MKVKMVVVQGKPLGKVLTFPHGEFYFGRGTECHVRPNSEWVSRQHCLLRVTSDGAYLRDLGSRNGTLVNGVLLEQEKLLADGDQVQLGPLVFEVHLDFSSIIRRRAAPPAPPPVAPGDVPADQVTLEGHPAIPDEDSSTRSTEHHPALGDEPSGKNRVEAPSLR